MPVGTRQCEVDHCVSGLRMEPLDFFRCSWSWYEPVFVCDLALKWHRSPVGTIGSPVGTRRQCEKDLCASRLRMEPLVRRAKSCSLLDVFIDYPPLTQPPIPFYASVVTFLSASKCLSICLTCSLIIHPPNPTPHPLLCIGSHLYYCIDMLCR